VNVKRWTPLDVDCLKIILSYCTLSYWWECEGMKAIIVDEIKEAVLELIQ